MIRRLATGVLADRTFRRLWYAQVLSSAGSGVSLVAMPVYLLEAYGPAAVGIFLGTVTLARIVTLPYSGLLADRLSRSTVVRLGYLISAAGTGGLVLFPDASLILVLATAVLYGSGFGFFYPAMRALLPDVAGMDRLEQAQGILSTTYNVFALASPAISGVAIAWADPRTILLADVVSYLLALVVLPSVRLSATPADVPEIRVGSILDAFHTITRVPWVAAGMAQTAVQVLLGFAPGVILIRVVGEQRYGDQALGLILSVSGASALVGTLVAARWRPRRPGLFANLGFVSYAAVELCIGFPVPLPTFVVVLFLSGAAISWHGLWWYAAICRRFPGEMRGRVNALDMATTGALEPVGMALAVPVMQLVGVAAMGLLGAAVFVAAPLLTLVVPGFVRYQDPAAVQTPVPAAELGGVPS